MTHYLGDKPIFTALATSPGLFWKDWKTRLRHHNENRGTVKTKGAIATPRPLAGWQCDALSALATRHGPVRSTPNSATATTPDTAPTWNAQGG